ncbi:MAG: sulfatase-like hydrolase/transferase [Conexivisphaera sp.]
MRRPNVVLVVVDSLREDSSGGLEALLDMGFVRYENAVAPAPWTLPSHVSMFTGLYPSAHGVHEEYSLLDGGRLDEAAVAGMSRLGHGLIGELMEEGYEAHFVTANLYITPQYGFTRYTRHLTASPYLPEALDWDEFSGINASFWRNGRNYLRTAREFVQMGRGGLLWRAVLRAARLRIGVGLTDKGSGAILRALGALEAHEPFVLFVNLMEAHEPYTPGDLSGTVSAEAAFDAVFRGGPPRSVVDAWRRHYPGHAGYAARRAVEVVRALGRRLDGSITIVTSDHGQLLGDGGIGHGYFLADGVLRVPLYVRWPSWMRAPRQVGRYVSLTQVPSMIRGSMGAGLPGVGTNVALAESFGPISLPPGWRSRVTRRELRSAFSHRIRIYARGGTATYDAGADVLEEVRGMSPGEAREIAGAIAGDLEGEPAQIPSA